MGRISMVVRKLILLDLLKIHVIVRFRWQSYTVLVDIVGIFLPAITRLSDPPSVCFLWREEFISYVEIFQTRCISSAPAIHQHALILLYSKQH